MTGRSKPTLPSSGPGAAAPCDSAVQSCPAAVIHARLSLKSVTFSGGYDVDNDTFGNFPTPHFLVGRAPDASPTVQRPAQFPYCVTRNTKLRAQAVFLVTQQPTATETVAVDAEAPMSGTTLRFKGNVSVQPSDTEVTIAVLDSDVGVPNMILKVDPLIIQWFQTPVDVPRNGVGPSANLLYVTLGTPQKSPLHWTLLEVSCSGASSKTSVAEMRTGSYGMLQGRAISRKRDNHDLTYWNPETTTAFNTQKLLAAPDGSGQCGSWAEFLVDMWKAHGDTGGHKIGIARDINLWVSNATMPLFLVKNWRFDPPHPVNPASFTYLFRVKCFELPGVAGQRNGNPPPHFLNHFIVKAGADYYDPSYGSPTFSTELAWENASIDGLGDGNYGPAPSGATGGYRKSEFAATRLLQFVDLATGATI